MDWDDVTTPSLPIFYYNSHSSPKDFYADTIAASVPGATKPPQLLPFNLAQVGWQRSLFFQELHLLTPSPLPPGAVNISYFQLLEAHSFNPPVTWSVVSGNLPAGIGLDTSKGILGGLPTAAGAYNFRLRVTDTAGATAERDFALTINSLASGPLQIASTMPAPGSPSVASDASIVIQFNRPMKFSTVNNSTVTVAGSASGTHGGIFAYNSGNYSATLSPNTAFAPGESVTVTVSRNVQSLEGDILAADHSFSFAIQSAAASGDVRVVYTDPAHGGPMVSRGVNISIVFSKPMAAATLTSANFQVTGSASGAHAAGFSYNSAAYLLTFDPSTDFSSGETVTVTVSRNVRALDGTGLAADYTFSFTAIGATPTPVTVSGNIPSNTTWTAGKVYHVTSNLTIPTNLWLYIERDAVVKFDGDRRLAVNGQLILDGTATRKIVFTSWHDDEYGGDSNGNGASSSPARGQWAGIQFNEPANLFNHAIVRYNNSVSVAGNLPGGLDIEDCVFEHSLVGIYVEAAQTPEITGCIFRNQGTAIHTYGRTDITQNTISGCDTALYLLGRSRYSIRENVLSGITNPIHLLGGRPNFSGIIFGANVNRVIATWGTLAQDTTWGNVQGCNSRYPGLSGGVALVGERS